MFERNLNRNKDKSYGLINTEYSATVNILQKNGPAILKLKKISEFCFRGPLKSCVICLGFT